MTTESKCGDDCKLVEMLANKTSKEQAMENALDALSTGLMTITAAAKKFGVARKTLSDRWAKQKVAAAGGSATASQSKEVVRSDGQVIRHITSEERDQWWAASQAGASARKIACQFGRSRDCVLKEINKRKEQEPQAQQEVAPPPALPEPPASVPSAGSSDPEPEPEPKPKKQIKLADHIPVPVDPTKVPRPSKEEMLKGWSGELNPEDSGRIHKRERPASKRRANKIIPALLEIKVEMEETANTATRDFRKIGAGIFRAKMAFVEDTLEKENVPSIEWTLRQIQAEAHRIELLASESLRLLMFND